MSQVESALPSAPGGVDVLWTDVGPRDGLQNCAITVATDAKVSLVRGLLEAGAPRVEATSLVSPRWVPQLADGPEVLAELSGEMGRLRVLIPNRRGLERALDAGVRNVLVTIGVTDTFNRRNVNRDVRASLDEVDNITDAAEQAGCTVDVALSVAFGCPFEGRVAPERVANLVHELAQLRVDEISLADTIGVAGPAQVRALCAPLYRRSRDWTAHLALHVHDTRGLGVANVLAAYGVGIRHFDGSVGGLGGCPFAPQATGNVASEDALQALIEAGARPGVDLDAYCAVAVRLGEELGTALPGKLHRAGVWHGEPVATAVEESV